MSSARKAVLEDLLRARRLHDDGPPLRGEERGRSALSTRIPALDGLLGGGLVRGQVSEIHGPVSSGRTGVALAVAARATQAGALVAWLDPGDRLDPASAADAGVDLSRFLWLRGGPNHARSLLAAVSAAGTLLGAGLFEVVVLDVAGLPPAALNRLPGATWIRLQRAVELEPGALLLVADRHLVHGPLGASLSLRPGAPQWSGSAGPGRLLRGLETEVRAGRHGARGASLELRSTL